MKPTQLRLGRWYNVKVVVPACPSPRPLPPTGGHPAPGTPRVTVIKPMRLVERRSGSRCLMELPCWKSDPPPTHSSHSHALATSKIKYRRSSKYVEVKNYDIMEETSDPEVISQQPRPGASSDRAEQPAPSEGEGREDHQGVFIIGGAGFRLSSEGHSERVRVDPL